MTSKVKIHSYMKYNKISNLFEELMGKLIEELPTNPIEYLIQILQNKSLEGAVKKSGTKSPPVSNKLWSTQKEVDTTSKNQTGREYQKPWLSNSKKHRSKQTMSKTAPSPLLIENSIDLKSTTPTSTTVPPSDENAEPVAVADKEEDKYNKFYGERKKVVIDEEEMKCVDLEINDDDESADVHTMRMNVRNHKKLRSQVLKQKLAEENEQEKVDDVTSSSGEEDDDVTELCEDYDDLKNEGVMRPPKSGIHIRRRAEQRKEQIEFKLNISKFFDNLGGTLETPQPSARFHFPNADDDDGDFESASQVTGPRQPVWEVAPSDVESVTSAQLGGTVSPRKMQGTTMFDHAVLETLSQGGHMTEENKRYPTQSVPSKTSKSSTKSAKKSKDTASTTISQMSPGKISGIKAQTRLKPSNWNPDKSRKSAEKTSSLVNEEAKRNYINQEISDVPAPVTSHQWTRRMKRQSCSFV